MWLFKEKIYFSCNQCGDCCKDMDVPLTHYDIKRIIDSGTDIDIETFVNLYPSEKQDIDSVILYGQYHTLYLTNKLSDNSCLFLINNACSIYNFRPNSCRIWPFSKDIKNKLLIDDIANQLVSVACDKKRFKDHDSTLEQINKGIDEVIEYRSLIKIWNKEFELNSEMQNLECFLKWMFEQAKLTFS